jgi:hypothetical protein
VIDCFRTLCSESSGQLSVQQSIAPFLFERSILLLLSKGLLFKDSFLAVDIYRSPPLPLF